MKIWQYNEILYLDQSYANEILEGESKKWDSYGVLEEYSYYYRGTGYLFPFKKKMTILAFKEICKKRSRCKWFNYFDQKLISCLTQMIITWII